MGCCCSPRREHHNVPPWRPTQSLIDEQPGWATFFFFSSASQSHILRIDLLNLCSMFYFKHCLIPGLSCLTSDFLLLTYSCGGFVPEWANSVVLTVCPSWAAGSECFWNNTHRFNTFPFCQFNVVDKNLLWWAAHVKNLKTSHIHTEIESKWWMTLETCY